MRKRLSLLEILLVSRILLEFVLCPQHSIASDQWGEDDSPQFQSLSKTIITESKETEVSYGDFDILSEDILFHHVLPQCNLNIIRTNRSFFTLVTGYESNCIFDRSFENKPSKPVCCIISNVVVNFGNYNIQWMPSFIWYSLTRHTIGIPPNYWLYLQSTQVQKVDLSHNRIDAMGAEKLGQCLKGTQVQTVNLINNQIGAVGTEKLGQCLKDTQVRTLDLSYNQIGAVGAEKLGQCLKDTQVHTLNLIYNQIGDRGAEKLGQCLKGTQVHTLNLRHNQIHDIGAERLGQSLKGTQVHTLNLRRNQIHDIGAEELGQCLQATQVRKVNLRNNLIGEIEAEKLRFVLKDINLKDIKFIIR